MTSRLRRVVALAAATIALAAGIYAGIAAYPVRRSEARLPSAALASLFALRLNDARGQTQAFDAWRGKTLVVNFWATWCPPCREEMPYFSRLSDRYAPHGVQFVGVALDSAENVSAFARQVPVSYPLLIAQAEGIELTRQLGNSHLALPYTLIIGASGETLLARLGRLPESELETVLQKTLAR